MLYHALKSSNRFINTSKPWWRCNVDCKSNFRASCVLFWFSWICTIKIPTNLLSNNIFNDKYTLTVNYSDVLNSNKRVVTSYGSDFIRELELQNRVPQINISLSYRFDSKSRVKEGLQYDDIKIIN